MEDLTKNQYHFNEIFPYGKGCYECRDIQFKDAVIAARFSGTTMMSGSPLLYSPDGEKWFVLGIYREGPTGAISRAVQDMKDWARVYGDFSSYEFDFSFYKSKSIQKKYRQVVLDELANEICALFFSKN